MSEPNLQVLRPSRKRLKEGDVFAMLPPDGLYVFGRVILVEPPREQAPMPKSNLVYVYRYRSNDKVPPPAALNRDDLLLPPLYINRLPWTRGYFETVAHWPLKPEDVRSHHSFRSALGGRYYDERGNEVQGPTEPVGDWGLNSYWTFDDALSDALGLPRAPE